MSSIKKILIVNPFGIGDVIFSAPLLEALSKIFPAASIGYICNKRAYEVIKSDPHVDKVFIYEKDDFRTLWSFSRGGFFLKLWQFLKKIRSEHFDVAIDLSLNYQSSLCLMMIGLPKRIGFNYRKRGKFLTSKIDIDGFSNKHVVEYYLETLKLLGVDPTKYANRPKVYVTETDKIWAQQFLSNYDVSNDDLLIGVMPGCGASWGLDAGYRRWHVDGFAKVCDSLVERYNAKIILLGDAKEAELGASIQKKMTYKPIVACGKTTIGDFLGLIKRCNLIVTNDGGPLHMAVGVGTKTVSIFGPVDEKIYGPYPIDDDNVVVAKHDLACRPCYKKFKYNMCKERHCLDRISPQDVLYAVERVLSKCHVTS